MSLSIFLMLFKKLQFFSEICIFDHLRGNGTFIEPLGNFTKATTYTPNIFNNFKDLTIDTPLDLAQNVQNLAHTRHVRSLQVPNSFIEIGNNFSHLCLFEVVAAKEEILPRGRLIYHGKRSLKLQA